jgi:short-subunit dehydrogenase
MSRGSFSQNSDRPADGANGLLAGRVALVTGASSGIGRAVALALAGRGMRVLLVGRREEALQAVAQQIGQNSSVIPADLATVEGRATVSSIVPSELDVLIHCAGAHLRNSMTTTDGAAWAALDAVNVHAPILLTAACLPALKAAAGQVVFVNSTAGLQAAGTGAAAYAAGKHALRIATDALRRDVNPAGIRVLSVYPGRTDTPMQAAILAQEGRVAAPGALIHPDDVAAMILAALLLPKSAEVTDITLRPMRLL